MEQNRKIPTVGIFTASDSSSEISISISPAVPSVTASPIEIFESANETATEVAVLIDVLVMLTAHWGNGGKYAAVHGVTFGTLDTGGVAFRKRSGGKGGGGGGGVDWNARTESEIPAKCGGDDTGNFGGVGALYGPAL